MSTKSDRMKIVYPGLPAADLSLHSFHVVRVVASLHRDGVTWATRATSCEERALCGRFCERCCDWLCEKLWTDIVPQPQYRYIYIYMYIHFWGPIFILALTSPPFFGFESVSMFCFFRQLRACNVSAAASGVFFDAFVLNCLAQKVSGEVQGGQNPCPFS